MFMTSGPRCLCDSIVKFYSLNSLFETDHYLLSLDHKSDSRFHCYQAEKRQHTLNANHTASTVQAHLLVTFVNRVTTIRQVDEQMDSSEGKTNTTSKEK